MGTILQERVSQQYLERVSIREREWRKKASWSNNRPNVASNKMGRRQSQRKSLQPQNTFPGQDSVQATEKRLQHRRKHKPNTPSTKCSISQHSAQETSDSQSKPASPAGRHKESKVQPAAHHCHHREQKHAGFRGTRHSPAFPCYSRSDSRPDLLEGQTPNPEAVGPSDYGEGDSDTDLSDSERLPSPPSAHVPPQLDLQPEVIGQEDFPSFCHRPRGQGHSSFQFPDFLPPPFNSWSLSQLAVFYNVEGRGTPRPRPVGPLERYLERLLQLEWHQIQTAQEESGKSTVSDVLASCHRSPASTSSRLSSPKSILQCQRAFPLTFLSSLASHSAQLSSCACTLCRIRFSTCSTACCRSSHGRQSRLSPLLERRGPMSLPKRSFSETRAHSSDKSLASRAQRFSSPVRGNSHLRRMQASGNIRNPGQGATTKPHFTARDSGIGARRDCLGAGDIWPGDSRSTGLRKRSGSEHRRGGKERQRDGSEKRSGSECRRGGAERRRAAEFKEQEIKPDAVTAIMDNLPASKHSPGNRPNRSKQVEFHS